MDDGNISILVLMDMSAAFDTVNYPILQRLSNVGIDGSVLNWIRSYLNERVSIVTIKGDVSSAVPIRDGVQQGSVLGHVLFSVNI
jgi:hypothetical protein